MGDEKDGLAGLTWIYPKENEVLKKDITREFGLHPIVAQILISRGFTSLEEIHSYLYGKLPDLHDPFLLTGMDAAAKRVFQALEQQEAVLVYGDNDVDGMTGVTLLTEFIRELGGWAYPHTSHRYVSRDELFEDASKAAMRHKCKLMITVDCGITAIEEIANLPDQIDVIVTDHHEPTDVLPRCIATLNPKLVGDRYPNRDLTGVGVAFKLVHAVTNALVAQGRLQSRHIDLKKYLDLVALGTVADMGSLVGENRILVRYGLVQLKKNRRIGLTKLMEVSEVDVDSLSTFDIGTKIAPRLNSLGRIADPQKGVELLSVKDSRQAEKLARELDDNNQDRQRIERVVSQEVDARIEKNPTLLKDRALVLAGKSWHAGVIPIVCTRICRQYGRPTAIIAIEEGVGKGSLRSIRSFPLLPVLKKASHLLQSFGGHDYAAGFTIPEENIEEFTKLFVKEANQELSQDDVLHKLSLDAEAQFSDLTFELLESIQLLEPYGNENPAPVLYCDATQAWPPKITGKHHLRLHLQECGRGGRILEGVGFGMAGHAPALKSPNTTLRVAFTPQINTFQNKSSIQLLVKDVKKQD